MSDSRADKQQESVWAGQKVARFKAKNVNDYYLGGSVGPTFSACLGAYWALPLTGNGFKVRCYCDGVYGMWHGDKIW